MANYQNLGTVQVAIASSLPTDSHSRIWSAGSHSTAYSHKTFQWKSKKKDKLVDQSLQKRVTYIFLVSAESCTANEQIRSDAVGMGCSAFVGVSEFRGG